MTRPENPRFMSVKVRIMYPFGRARKNSIGESASGDLCCAAMARGSCLHHHKILSFRIGLKSPVRNLLFCCLARGSSPRQENGITNSSFVRKFLHIDSRTANGHNPCTRMRSFFLLTKWIKHRRCLRLAGAVRLRQANLVCKSSAPPSS